MPYLPDLRTCLQCQKKYDFNKVSLLNFCGVQCHNKYIRKFPKKENGTHWEDPLVIQLAEGVDDIESKHKDDYAKCIFTKNYKMRDNIADERFNDEYNKTPELKDLFRKKKNNYTSRFFLVLREHIKNKDHIILNIWGEPNTGKSYGGLRLAEYITRQFKKLVNINSKFVIVRNDVEYMNIVEKINAGDVILRDEDPHLSGTGSRVVNWNLSNVVNISRKFQICFIFIYPKPIESKGIMTFFLKSAGINKKKETSRFLIYDTNFNVFGRIFIKMTKNIETLKKYEAKKDKNISNILKYAGSVNVEISSEKTNSDMKKLIKITREYKTKRKTEIKALISVYNNKNPDDKIVGLSSYLENLINIVYLELKKQKSEVVDVPIKKEDESMEKSDSSIDPIEKLEDFGIDLTNNEISMEEIFKVIREESKWYDINREIEIWEKQNNGILYKDIAKDNDLSIPEISNIVKKVNGAINLYKGKILESKIYNSLKKSGKYKKINLLGGISEPDLIAVKNDGTFLVLSIKNLKIKKLPYSIKKKELTPEYKKAFELSFKHKKVELYLIVNNNINNIIKVMKLDYKNPKNVIIK